MRSAQRTDVRRTRIGWEEGGEEGGEGNSNTLVLEHPFITPAPRACSAVELVAMQPGSAKITEPKHDSRYKIS